MTSLALAAAPPTRIWAVALATLFGRETRYVGRLYAGRVFVFATLILAVVLSLDAARNLNDFFSEQSDAAAPEALAGLSYYLLLRLGYNIPAVLPVSAWIGVIWAEFSLAMSRQRMMIANSGQQPLRSLAPAFVVGLCLGLLQFTALAYVRPASIEAQAVSDFRNYGPKFEADAVTGRNWISVEGAVLRARIAFGDPPTLREAIIFDLDGDGGLQSIRTARRATPVEPGHWRLDDATVWHVPRFFNADAPVGGSWRIEHAETQTIALTLDPVWVENFDIRPTFLPQSVLSYLGTVERGVQNRSTYAAALQERFAAIVYLMGMMLLPAALAITQFLPGMGAGPAVNAMFWGISAYFGTSVLSQMGAFGYLPAPVSAWAIPVLIVLAAVAIILARARHPKI